jgi:alkanesulfonate monooxygenase SsuD/methylene tetrahydromethanopterin reductase-like flavin-dependent oxidoreductase (luciferase family)
VGPEPAPRLRLPAGADPRSRNPRDERGGALRGGAGCFVVGLRSSSEPIVKHWNALPFEKPYQRTRDTVRFLRAALAGEKVDQAYETFTVRGFRLRRKADPAPPILVAALRAGMLDLAGREGDGVILNYVTPEDLPKVVPLVKKHGAGKEIAARIYVCPTREAERVRAVGRMSIAGYFNVPTYRAHQEWLGRGAARADVGALGAVTAGRPRGAPDAVDRSTSTAPPSSAASASPPIWRPAWTRRSSASSRKRWTRSKPRACWRRADAWSSRSSRRASRPSRARSTRIRARRCPPCTRCPGMRASRTASR